MTHTRKYGALLLSLALVAAAAVAGSLFTVRAVPGWYAGLAKPSWTPPDRLFGPTWTILYIMMAVAVWLVYLKKEGTRRALWLYVGQLLLNAVWSPVFFGARMPGAALVVIILLWPAIAATIVEFFRIRRLSGWLMVPYLLWVTYAAALNFAIWRLN